jgi:hypothetical protein
LKKKKKNEDEEEEENCSPNWVIADPTFKRKREK